MNETKYLIFGGTGSLGHALNRRILRDDRDIVVNFSRDEAKHWKMKMDFGSNPRQHFHIGDCSDVEAVEQCLRRHKPDIVILAQAMKHIDLCEKDISACLKNNFLGTKVVLDTIEKYHHELGISKVILISSDKACNPINSYGLCKAMSENLMLEKQWHIGSKSNIDFINVRYGNVLNSKGSILQILDDIGKDETKDCFNLTDAMMTRFIMTMDNAVDLVVHAITSGKPGDTIVSGLKACRIIDMMELFSATYNKPIKVTGLRSGEKLAECLINEDQCRRTVYNQGYYHIRSHHVAGNLTHQTDDADWCRSDYDLVTKHQLWQILKSACSQYKLLEPH